MEYPVFFAVILAALLHASWNAAVKGHEDKHLGMACIIIGHAPLALILAPFFPVPSLPSWPYLAAGVIFHFGYQLSLLTAYRFGDLTHVYPIARGSAPLIVAAFSILFLQVDLQPLELAAIALIIIGILSLALVRHSQGTTNLKVAAIAVMTGCFIAGYSLCDGLGARITGSAIGFYSWLSILNAVIFAAYLRMTRPGTVRRVFTEGARITLIGGTASYCAYALVVWGFTQAPIAAVTALRETSIIFALIIGVVFLKEPLNLIKVFATAMTLTGSILLRFAR